MKPRLTLHELVVGRLPGVVVVGGVTYLVARAEGIDTIVAVGIGLVVGVAFELVRGSVLDWLSGIDIVSDLFSRRR